MATTICHVMLCYVSHSSHLNVPQTVWTRRTHWGFSIWGPSPLPDICKALKAPRNDRPKSDLPEIRFQKQNRKKHPKDMDLNDYLICRFVIASCLNFKIQLNFPNVYVQLRSAHSRFERIRLQCPCAAVVASKAIETNLQNSFMVELRMFLQE